MPDSPPTRSFFPIWAWVAAAALALITGYLVRQMGAQTTQLADLRRQIKRAQTSNEALQAQLELSQQVSTMMLSPDSRPVKLSPRDAKAPPLLVYLNPHLGGVIVGENLSPVPASRTWQLWLTPKTGSPVSVAVFHPNADGLVSVVAPIQVPTELIAAFTVTDEPAGGSPQPTSAPLWSAQLK